MVRTRSSRRRATTECQDSNLHQSNMPVRGRLRVRCPDSNDEPITSTSVAKSAEKLDAPSTNDSSELSPTQEIPPLDGPHSISTDQTISATVENTLSPVIEDLPVELRTSEIDLIFEKEHVTEEEKDSNLIHGDARGTSPTSAKFQNQNTNRDSSMSKQTCNDAIEEASTDSIRLQSGDSVANSQKSEDDVRNRGSETQGKSRDNFGWLLGTGEIITIDPADTIPLACVREISPSGVKKLEQSFLNGEGGMSVGVSSAAPQPIVVRIPKEHLDVVVSYFVSKKCLEEENAVAISLSKVWYGVVEGAHRRKALINLGMNVPERFKGYAWVVICIKWQSLHILRALARERNELLRSEHLVDFTMYDVLKGLKLPASEVAIREGATDRQPSSRGFRKRVADYYCGGKDKANNLTCQLAGIAISIPWPVIEEIGVLLNTEDPDVAKEIAHNPREEEKSPHNARIRRNLLTKSTFRGATTFKTVATEGDQINTIRRLGYLAPDRNYKPFNKVELEAQTKKAIAARAEVDKMKEKLRGHVWPDDMDIIRRRLLATTTMDDQVEINARSDEILPEFRSLWLKFFPIAAEHEAANKIPVLQGCLADHADSSWHVASDTCDLKNDINDESIEDSLNTQDTKDSPNVNVDSQTCLTRNEDEHLTENVSSDGIIDGSSDSIENEEDKNELCPLRQLSVRAENQSWKDVRETLLREEPFEFIIADLQQSLSALQIKQGMWTEFKDEQNIREFANFCRVFLRPRCYCFIFVLAEEFSAWRSALHEEGMDVMGTPFHILPDASSTRVTRLKGLPQPCGELGIVARAPGTSSGFSINYKDPYGLFECTFTRKFGVIDHAPRCVNPLTSSNSKAVVRPRERHPNLVSEIIETFCPAPGKVLDAFAGAMTTALSCIASKRACLLVEKDKYCFDLAIRRLEKICRDELLKPED